MENVKELIIKSLKKAVKDLTGLEVSIQVEHPSDEKHGDYSSNIGMVLFKDKGLRIKDKKYKNPLELAQLITEKINNSSLVPNPCSRVEVAPPGFINFWLSKDYLTTLIRRSLIIRVRDEYGQSEKLKNKKIMLEFADPNPFKEFHIGHLRNITLGECYARLLESQGATVWRVNYQGDVGMHVAKTLYAFLPNSKFKIQNSKLEERPLADRVKLLGEAYALGAKAYEEDENAKKEIQSLNIKIYKNDPSIRKIWETGRRWSLDYFEEIYKRVGTAYKRYYFESEVAGAGRKIVLDHIKNSIFERSEDAVIFKGEKYGFHTRVFVTKEDYATYEAKDMALAGIKYKDFPYDKSIIITAHEQAPYFKVVLAAMKMVEPKLSAKTFHYSFGFVSLKEEKMSSRLGNIVTGEFLMDEAKARVKKQFKNMDDKTAEAVGVGAVKYSMLKFSKESDIKFSFDESISLEGNSGPYLQYTFARTQSLIRKSEIRNPKHETNPNFQNLNVKKVSNFGHSNFDIVSNFDIRYSDLKLQNEEGILLRTLYKFPEVVEEAAEKFAPNLLCNYLFDLAQKFNFFYQRVPILINPRVSSKVRPCKTARSHLAQVTQDFRLALTMAVGKVIKNGLYLLGISAPDRM